MPLARNLVIQQSSVIPLAIQHCNDTRLGDRSVNPQLVTKPSSVMPSVTPIVTKPGLVISLVIAAVTTPGSAIILVTMMVNTHRSVTPVVTHITSIMALGSAMPPVTQITIGTGSVMTQKPCSTLPPVIAKHPVLQHLRSSTQWRIPGETRLGDTAVDRNGDGHPLVGTPSLAIPTVKRVAAKSGPTMLLVIHVVIATRSRPGLQNSA